MLWTIVTPPGDWMQQSSWDQWSQTDPPDGDSQSGGSTVLLSQPSPQDLDDARVALVLIVASLIFFWRIMLKVAIAILVVAVILGVFMLLKGVHL